MSKILLILLVSLISLTSVFGQVKLDDTTSSNNAITTLVVKQNTISDIKIPCFNSTGNYCDTTVKCNLTLIYPNSSTLIKNAGMTNQVYFNNYTLSQTQTETAGIYSGTVSCVSSGQGSGFSPIKLLINKDGIDLSGNITAIVLVSTILVALLIFFIVMAIILETYLKLVFAGLAFVMLPIVLAVADSIIQDALLPASIINIVGLGYTLSLYMLATFILYIMYKLTMDLKLRNNANDGAKTATNIQSNNPKQKEKIKTDYEEDDDTFEE